MVKLFSHELGFRSEQEQWETPQTFFDTLDAEFHFDLDVCATRHDTKCVRYITPEQDALQQPWGGICWMNPPYGRHIGLWIQKAFHEATNGATVVALIPSRTDTRWWHEFVMRGEIRFVKGRLMFGGCVNHAPFPSAVVIFRPSDQHDVQQIHTPIRMFNALRPPAETRVTTGGMRETTGTLFG